MRKRLHFHIGLRTLKTAVAVLIAMVLVEFYGTSDSKLIFAMLGAMTAMRPTFRESLYACLAQLVGVLLGAVLGVGLLKLPIPGLAQAGIGIVLVITLYNMLRIPFAPDLPCLVVVLLCVTPDIQPWAYAIGRFWDTFIGLVVGMLINVLVFPYDNRRRIRDTVQSLDKEVLVFLEELFDGDEHLPDAEAMEEKIDYLDAQLKILTNQKTVLRMRHRKVDLETYRQCEKKARELAAQMEVLYQMGRPGVLSAENRERLKECGAVIQDPRGTETAEPLDIVTNYHVSQILTLREELLKTLEK
ncbi:MAG: FUSC family protein [Oscillospiraceae bacterium]|nr:FUSC family protein [Oscillospiraceae bacterium]